MRAVPAVFSTLNDKDIQWDCSNGHVGRVIHTFAAKPLVESGSAVPSDIQLDDFGFDEASFNLEPADAHRQFESPWPRAPRIEVKHPIARFSLGNVAVAGDHDFESGGFGLQIELGAIVEHIDRHTGKFDNLGLRQLARPGTFIDVAADRSERCDR